MTTSIYIVAKDEDNKPNNKLLYAYGKEKIMARRLESSQFVELDFSLETDFGSLSSCFVSSHRRSRKRNPREKGQGPHLFLR